MKIGVLKSNDTVTGTLGQENKETRAPTLDDFCLKVLQTWQHIRKGLFVLFQIYAWCNTCSYTITMIIIFQ